ncbi:hypothetical protein RclHR1_08770002 [Rhizophagus clarus]|uniref:Uncharacterized protein n=1 Tax=Rhizophagus clarus TaxID=94130 RepID=A0A2Z6S8C4_9GLOM|nr:hypothetical protein RclHR1_08770002 [Rhizophagus clarus]
MILTFQKDKLSFARRKGYNVFISGTNKKLCHRWMLPDIKDTAFRNESLIYLEFIIRDEIANYVHYTIVALNFDNEESESSLSLDSEDSSDNESLSFDSEESVLM